MNKRIIFLALLSAAVLSGCASSKRKSEKLTPQELIKQNRLDEAMGSFLMPNDINGVDDYGNTVLHLAAEINNADLCTFFIIKGADPELKNFESNTPLHVAILNEAYDAARIIAETGGCLFSTNADGVTALDLGLETNEVYYDLFITEKTGAYVDDSGRNIVHYFVLTKNLRGIEACINNHLPVSIKDNNGKTPLDLAFDTMTDSVSVQIAADLIMAGADEVDTEYSYFQEAVSARNLSIRFSDGQTPLHMAAIYGHEAIAKYLVNNKADLSAQDSSGATPLHEAVRYGNLGIAKYLLEKGAPVNARDNLGKSPIMIIMPKDKIRETYTLFIEHHADLDLKDMFGDTVLHTAALMSGDIGTIGVLTNRGVDINARNKEGVTPLQIAVQNGDVEVAKLFTNCGANIHTQDQKGDSPLSLALAGSTDMLEAVVNLYNCRSQDSDGNTPLHIALLSDAPISKIQYIVSLTDDINIRNRDGNSALFIAVLKNRQKVGDMLLAKGADIFSANKNNNSPLRLALRYGGKVQDWLITSKTIKQTDGSGNTVLHYAAEWQYSTAISSLLTKGADINAKNANGETPLFSAAKTNNPDIVQLIVDGGGNIYDRDYLGSTPVHMAVRWDAPLCVEKLISLGADINAQNSNGKSPLAEAVLSGKEKLAEFLLKNGADENCTDTNGVTVLMDGIHGANAAIVQLLLDYGANPNMQDINGRNAYHEAALMGNIDIIRLIRTHGGNPLSRDKAGVTPFAMVLKRDRRTISEVLGTNRHITDSDGNSPVHIVVKSDGSTELLESLIADGYPLDTRNADGYTPLNYAIEKNDVDTALILLEAGANPFQMIDKKGRNGVTIALEKENKKMIGNIVKYAGLKSDVQGNTILHYAAKISSEAIVKNLLSYGLDVSIKNVSGDTPYTVAVRWKRGKVADLLKVR